MTARITSGQNSSFHQLMDDTLTLLNPSRVDAQAVLSNPKFHAHFRMLFLELSGHFPSMLHATDLIPYGWKFVKDNAAATDLDVTTFVLKPFINSGEGSISWGRMLNRAVKLKGNMGLSDGKLLMDHESEIPALSQLDDRSKHIILPGTVLRDKEGRCRFPLLIRRDEGLIIVFGFIPCRWRANDLLACSE